MSFSRSCRAPVILPLVVAFLFLLSLAFVTEAHAETFSGRVVDVADGDSITVLNASMILHNVRLAGIDAPERSQPFGADFMYSREEMSQ
jgi:endonuclease YncB( thermonuclease family)